MELTLFTILASALVMPVIAQQQSTSVTQIYIPFADQQPLDASLVNEHNNIATLVVQCAPGTDDSDCGFPSPITITAGPSTFHYSGVGTYTIIGEIDCKITGSSVADCIATQGVYDTASIETATDTNWITEAPSSSITTSGELTGSEVTFLAVTITAGLSNTNGGSVSMTSGSAVATKSGSGSMLSSTSGSVRATATSTATATATTASKNGAGQLLLQANGLFGMVILVAGFLVMA